jgi:hypothetical protein
MEAEWKWDGISEWNRIRVAEYYCGNAEWKRSGNGMVFQSGIGSELRSIIAETRSGNAESETERGDKKMVGSEWN